MKITLKSICFLTLILLLSTCASSYRTIKPSSLNYLSSSEIGNVKLAYKYNLLSKKYFKKELKNGVKLAAVKITNNSNKDYVFGKNLNITYSNGHQIPLLENSRAFHLLKQNTPSYLLYLLLMPMRFEVYQTTNGYPEVSSSTPIGLLVGPGFAASNMTVAGSANKKFKLELEAYDLMHTSIKSGETKYGIIVLNSNSSESLQLKLE